MKFNSINELNSLFPKGVIISTHWYGNHRCIIKVDRFEGSDNSEIKVIGDGVTAENRFKFNADFGISGNDVSYANDSEIEYFNEMLERAKKLEDDIMTKIGILAKEYGVNISININNIPNNIHLE